MSVLLEKLDDYGRASSWVLSSRSKQFRKQWEVAAANATGPAVAGTGDDSSTVVVRKKKRKTALFTVTPDVFSDVLLKVKRSLNAGANT